MRIWLSTFAVFILWAPVVRAQDHLVPDVDVFVDPDNYKLMMRHIFARAFEDSVALRVLVIPSFDTKEYAMGLLVTDKRVEVFVLEPSVTIWNIETIRMYESGEAEEVDSEGKAIPLEENVTYQKLKKSTPSDYRKIKAERRARPIPREVAAEIKRLWDEMLLNVRHPTNPVNGLDGVTYDFSADIKGRGELSGHIWSPEPESKSGRLTTLAETMADYARGKADLRRVIERLKAAREP